MRRTVALSIRPTADDAAKLERTAAAFNAACDWISGVAYAEGVFNTVRLHHRVYNEARARFHPLQSQFVVRAIGVVADAYRRDRKVRHRFRPDAAVVYDERLLRFGSEPEGGHRRASLATLEGRIVCTLAIGGYQRALLTRAARTSQADLLRDPKGRWRLHVSVTLPDPPPADLQDGVLGVDLGIVNLAADSDGTRYAGAHVNGLRRRYHRLRAKLQAKGTRAARRRLRSWKARQARFQRQVDHLISKRLVQTAATSRRALAVEDLNGIRARARAASRDQRRRLHGWSFARLRAFLAYKAEAAGVPVVAVDPRHTSQTCPACGLIDRKNRPDRATFRCIGCGLLGHADTVAAVNIARRGLSAAGVLVNHPHFSAPGTVVSHDGASSLGKSCPL
jgi:putative transposase